jgi:mono/diheme cytochrome c family protein
MRAAGQVVMRVLLAALLLACASAHAADGKASFDYHCGKCHAPGGTGTLMLTKRFGKDQSLLQDRKELTVESVRRTVRWGSLSMPRITRVEVPDAELDAIARYLVSERK